MCSFWLLNCICYFHVCHHGKHLNCVNCVSCAPARSKCDQEGPQDLCGVLCINSCKGILGERCLVENVDHVYIYIVSCLD